MPNIEFSEPVPTRATLFGRRGSAFTRGLLGIALVLLVRQLLASANVINAVLLAVPLALPWTTINLPGDGTLIRHIGASIECVLVGVLCAAAVGLILGVLLGWPERLSQYLRPILEALRPISPIAWTPLAIRWFGIGNASRPQPVKTGPTINDDERSGIGLHLDARGVPAVAQGGGPRRRQRTSCTPEAHARSIPVA